MQPKQDESRPRRPGVSRGISDFFAGRVGSREVEEQDVGAAKLDHQDSSERSDIVDRDLSKRGQRRRDRARDLEKNVADGNATKKETVFSRLEHFTWAWFTMTMSSGGLALVINEIPYRFHGLTALGSIVFLLNLTLFLTNVCLISFRFIKFPWTLKSSFLHPTESLFISAAFLSIATIILGCQSYGGSKTGPWFPAAMRVVFWIYCGTALPFTVGIHYLIWTTQTHPLEDLTPSWILPIYPLLLVGPLAGNIGPTQPPEQAFEMFLAGLGLQGIGFAISFMIYSAYVYRLMTKKLPAPVARPGMFISVGPSAFTITGMIKLGKLAKHAFPKDLLDDGELMAKVTHMGFLWIGVWLWGLALWFWFVSASANLGAVLRRKLDFTLSWWAFVFPSTAFVLATFSIGNELDSTSIKTLGTVLAVVVTCFWVFILTMTVRGVALRQIMYVNKAEDREEGGFLQRQTTRRQTFSMPAGT